MHYPTKKLAMIDAKAFEQKAIDEGFVDLKLDVFENIGWHFCLRGNYIQFWPYGNKISVLAGGEFGGRPSWSNTNGEMFKTFTQAYKAVVKNAEIEIKELNRILGLVKAHKKG